jgi:hypothetical protein
VPVAGMPCSVSLSGEPSPLRTIPGKRRRHSGYGSGKPVLTLRAASITFSRVMNGLPHVPSGDSDRAFPARQIGRSAARAVLAVIAFGALTLVGLQSVHAIDSRSSAGQARQWERDSAFWNCLTIQAHSLVVPGEHVQINQAGLPTRVMLEKVVGGWTILVTNAKEATAVLLIKNERSRRSCLGSVVVEYAPGSNLHGRPERIGSGASDHASNSLPSTPL